MNSLRRVLVGLAAALVALLGFGSAAGAAPYHPNVTVSVSTANVHAGMTITISGVGATANGQVTIVLHSTPVTLGTTTADANGNYSMQATMPDFCGPHELQARDVTTGKTGSTQLQFPACSPGQRGSGGGSGGLSNTGVAVAGIGGLGVLLVIGGGLMLLFGRRRRATV